MSQQVNYWLQKLGFYGTNTAFVEKSEPKKIGVINKPPYYTPSKSGAFREICGKKYLVDNQYYLFPILHVKSYPLEGNLLTTYGENYTNCVREIRNLINSLKVNNE